MEQHTPFDQVPAVHDIVPPTLPAGSVILYNPKTMHCGGSNTEPQNKVVLDIMFKAGGMSTESGDDTPERFGRETTRHGEDVLSYSRAWTTVWREYLDAHKTMT